MLIIELQYFTPVISYSALIKNTNIYFCLYETYHRRSFRNRCFIAGANGPISLSVPIAGGRNKKGIYKDLRIDYSNDWRQQHWRSIFSAYGNSPWFFNYADSLEKLYSQKLDFLVEWNFLCMDWVNQSLGIYMVPLVNSDVTFGKLGDFWKVGGLLESGASFGELGNPWRVMGPLEGLENNENPEIRNLAKSEVEVLDWRNRVVPANFQNIELGPFPVYTQVFEDRFGFQPNLSILDFILCCGKQSLNKLLPKP